MAPASRDRVSDPCFPRIWRAVRREDHLRNSLNLSDTGSYVLNISPVLGTHYCPGQDQAAVDPACERSAIIKNLSRLTLSSLTGGISLSL